MFAGRPRENGRSSVSSDGINRRWIPGGWCMIHHRIAPHPAPQNGVHVAHTIMRAAHERTRDRGLAGYTWQGWARPSDRWGRVLLFELHCWIPSLIDDVPWPTRDWIHIIDRKRERGMWLIWKQKVVIGRIEVRTIGMLNFWKIVDRVLLSIWNEWNCSFYLSSYRTRMRQK